MWIMGETQNSDINLWKVSIQGSPRVLACIIITVKFQLRSSINIRLVSLGQPTCRTFPKCLETFRYQCRSVWRHFGTGVPKCLKTKYRCRSVLGPKCPGAEVSVKPCYHVKVLIFGEWALYGIKPVLAKPSVPRYWWPSVNSVKTRNSVLEALRVKLAVIQEEVWCTGLWNFRSLELSLHGTFQANGGWSESTQPGAKVPAIPLANRARNGSVVNCN